MNLHLFVVKYDKSVLRTFLIFLMLMFKYMSTNGTMITRMAESSPLTAFGKFLHQTRKSEFFCVLAARLWFIIVCL